MVAFAGLVLTLLLLAFANNGNQTSANKQSETNFSSGKIDIEQEPKSELEKIIEEKKTYREQEVKLTEDGNAKLEEYLSNGYFYVAQLEIAITTLDVTVKSGGDPIDKGDVQSALQGAEESLNNIVAIDAAKNDIQRIVKDIDKAIQKDVDLGADILDNLHERIHNLDKHFNKEDSYHDVPVNKYGIPINEEDRKDWVDYSTWSDQINP